MQMSLVAQKLLATRPWHMILDLITFQKGSMILQKGFLFVCFLSLTAVKEAWYYYPIILLSATRTWPSGRTSCNSELLTGTKKKNMAAIISYHSLKQTDIFGYV